MGTTYFLNLSFVCNERCVFCAANLAKGGWVVDGRRGGVTLEDVMSWVGSEPPGPSDEVALAGGEPTLHRDLVPIVRYLGRRCPSVVLFTNGLRLADPVFARSLLEAGVSHIEIGLFGSTPDTHDAVTRRPGSLEQTLRALRVLGRLHDEFHFVLEVRLLVSRQSVSENPAIVRKVHESVVGVDVFSLNRLILSVDASASGAAVSWADARPAINETARLVRALGYELRFDGLPLCVYEDDNAAHVRAWVAGRRGHGETAFVRTQVQYLDPRVAVGHPVGELTAPLALPRPCRICDYLAFCGRIEEWYVERYGVAGIEPVSVGGSEASAEVAT